MSWNPLSRRAKAPNASPKMPPKTTTPPQTVADLFLQTLAEAKVDYIFAVLGSDHPSIIEAYMKRQHEGKIWPKMLIFQHEFPALCASTAYTSTLTHSVPQCVLVHVDVGTAALGQGLHNASVGRVPVLIFAGLAPCTIPNTQESGVLGGRSEHVHWLQDVPNQASLVAPYARYSNEIKTNDAGCVRALVRRGLRMALGHGSGGGGPTYLTCGREVLRMPISFSTSEDEVEVEVEQNHTIQAPHLSGLPPSLIPLLSQALLSSSTPLIITSYLGRTSLAVEKLLDLTNLVLGLKVYDAENRYMSFPATHPAWITRSTGAAEAIREADFLLVLDCDVPWIPSQAQPSRAARVFHIDVDPLKARMGQFDVQAEATFRADCGVALEGMVEFIVRHKQHESMTRGQKERLRGRWEALESAHRVRLEVLAKRAEAHWSGAMGIDFVGAVLRTTMPRETVYVHDVVTNTGALMEQLQLERVGSCLGKGGSGLGWAGGAAVGVKLAKERFGAGDLVCCVLGDGAFVFGVPTAVFWAQKNLDTPFLTVVLNNGGWKATRIGISDVHPQGFAAAAEDRELGIDLRDDGPDYVGVAVAASNGYMWGAKVRKAEELESAVREAVRVVREEKRGAMLELIIS